METVQHAIEVAVPLHTAYEQLSHFENYPQFMTGIKQATRLSDTRAHWVMELNGQRQEFDAEITECREDERVAWKSSGTSLLSEVITLQAKGTNRTQVTAELAADAQLLLPSDAHAEESLSKLLKADLGRFKQYAERHPIGDLPPSTTGRSASDLDEISDMGSTAAATGSSATGRDSAMGGDPASPATASGPAAGPATRSGKTGGGKTGGRSATASPADVAQNAGAQSRGARRQPKT